MLMVDDWKDYELIDAGGGEKLERWGGFKLRRPDPQAIWPTSLGPEAWLDVDAFYHRSASGGGYWEYFSEMPEKWIVHYRSLSFYIQLTSFKHTGLFPEQASNWSWMIENIGKQHRPDPVKVLNLFAYTGAATVACLYAGAEVCHVDASKGMVTRAKENAVLSGLASKPSRYIVDDTLKFVQREARRGNKYDAVIMDPPSYGRGPDGEIWKIEDHIFTLVENCLEILSDIPAFFLINSYSTGLSPTVLQNLLHMTVSAKYGGRVTCDELGTGFSNLGLILPCGTFARWQPV